jgi:hypothetical protein
MFPKELFRTPRERSKKPAPIGVQPNRERASALRHVRDVCRWFGWTLFLYPVRLFKQLLQAPRLKSQPSLGRRRHLDRGVNAAEVVVREE